MRADPDVVVIGGGPGGSTTASAIAMDGHRVTLLERERFPRYHVGESLLPATVQGVCRFLGVERELARAGFMRKYGATFRWGRSNDAWHVGFAEALLAGADGPGVYAYQVERSRFDAILLTNARRRGVQVRHGWRAVDAIVEDGRVAGVVARDREGRQKRIRARYTVDASGQAGVLATRLGRREYDAFFKNIAVFGYYRGGRRQPGRRRGNVLSAAFRDGWIWYIPLAAGLTSVGAVVRSEEASTIRRIGAADALQQYVRACPLIAEFLSDATRITRGPLGVTRTVKDYSYRNDSLWIGGAAFIGDAALFVDPLFSSGVHLATYAGLLAARSINSCLRGELEEPRAFSEFERRYRREFRLFYEFLFAFYETHPDETSAFWTARKLLNAPGVGPRESLVRLLAGLGQAEGEPLTAGAGVLKALQRQLRALRDAMDGTSLRPAERRARRRHIETQSRERQELWRLGGASRRGPADRRRVPSPLFTDGLVPTIDGLRWREPRSR